MINNPLQLAAPLVVDPLKAVPSTVDVITALMASSSLSSAVSMFTYWGNPMMGPSFNGTSNFDGVNADFDGVSDVYGWTRVGTVYTCDAAYYPQYYSMTIADGVTIQPNGCVLKAMFAALGENSVIDLSGTDATNASIGTNVRQGPRTAATSSAGNIFWGGQFGAVGRTTSAAGQSATTVANVVRIGGLGGKGGDGFYGTTLAGGAKITDSSQLLLKPWFHGTLEQIFTTGRFDVSTTRQQAMCAQGGSSGGNRIGSGSGTLYSGAGGNGAASVGIAIGTLLSCGTGVVIRLNGGDGGDAFQSSGGGNAGMGGGGGGGAGWAVIIIGDASDAANLPSVEANGGDGGDGLYTGAGTAQGGDGGDGGFIYYIVGAYSGATQPTLTANGGAHGADVNGHSTPSANGLEGVTHFRLGTTLKINGNTITA